MKRRPIFVISGLLALLGLLAGMVVLVRGTQPRILTLDQSDPTELRKALPLLSWPGEGPIYPADKMTLSEAQARVPFFIPLPTYLPNETAVIKEVWVSTFKEARDLDSDRYVEQNSVAIVFSDGLEMIIHQTDSPSDWQAILAEDALEHQPPVFRGITVNGRPGIGKNPGEQEIEGYRHPYPGSVSWWVDGLQISLYSDNLPLEELLRIATSMH